MLLTTKIPAKYEPTAPSELRERSLQSQPSNPSIFFFKNGPNPDEFSLFKIIGFSQDFGEFQSNVTSRILKEGRLTFSKAGEKIFFSPESLN